MGQTFVCVAGSEEYWSVIKNLIVVRVVAIFFLPCIGVSLAMRLPLAHAANHQGVS